MDWTTPDLCDTHPEVQVAEPLFRGFGGRVAFHGAITTVRCHEDNSRVRELAGMPGQGRVMVVDGGGSLRRALLGDQIAANAARNGWAGFLIHGAVRDVEVLAQLDLGVQALAAHPMKKRSAAWARWTCRCALPASISIPAIGCMRMPMA